MAVPAPSLADHPLVAAARRLADDVLAPDAERVDAQGVPREHLRQIAAAGLLGLAAPAPAGGAGAPPAVFREVGELLAGADCSTWFVQVQHHTPVLRLLASGLRPELLADLATGRALAGVAFAHLRRMPDRPVTATRTATGWRLDGHAPWYTGWGLNDVAMIGAITDDDQVLFAGVPARDVPGLTAGPELRLAALSATRTVPLDLHGLEVTDADVMELRPHAEWAAADRATTVNATPGAFGVTRRAIDLLEGHREPGARRAGARLRERLGELRDAVYARVDAVPRGHPLEPDDAAARLELRALVGRLAVEATSALVVAGAGRSMLLTEPAQRLAREAQFLLVQAQTAESRAAALELWGAPGPPAAVS
jgi:alkylation response protein AidB-like acyl-CoA dehydrogenase